MMDALAYCLIMGDHLLCWCWTEKEFLDYRLASSKLALEVANVSSGELRPTAATVVLEMTVW